MVALLIALSVAAPKLVSEHITDTCVSTQCTRTISNDLNFKDDTGTLYPSEEDLELGSWAGPDGELYAYRKRSRMTVYAGCTTCLDNSTYAVEVTEFAGIVWLQVSYPAGPGASWSKVDARTVKWSDVMPNSDLFVRYARKAFLFTLQMTGNPGQAFYDVTYRFPAGGTVTPVAGGWTISGGGVIYRVDEFVMWDDANGSLAEGPSFDGTLIPCTTVVQSNTVADGIRTVTLRVAPVNNQDVLDAFAAGRKVFAR